MFLWAALLILHLKGKKRRGKVGRGKSLTVVCGVLQSFKRDCLGRQGAVHFTGAISCLKHYWPMNGCLFNNSVCELDARARDKTLTTGNWSFLWRRTALPDTSRGFSWDPVHVTTPERRDGGGKKRMKVVSRPLRKCRCIFLTSQMITGVPCLAVNSIFPFVPPLLVSHAANE